jgi:hypothetical protein
MHELESGDAKRGGSVTIAAAMAFRQKENGREKKRDVMALDVLSPECAWVADG